MLMSFSEAEIQKFRDFVKSPYFNDLPKLYELLNSLMFHLKSGKTDEVTAHTLYAAVNPGKKYDDNLFRKYMSKLALLAEEFLGIQEALNNRNKRLTNILYGLANKDCQDSLKRYFQKLRTAYSSEKELDHTDFLAKHLQSIVMYNYYAENDLPDYSRSELREAFHNLLMYFIFHYSFIQNQSELDEVSGEDYSDSDSGDLHFLAKIVGAKELAGGFVRHEIFKNKKEENFAGIVLNDMDLLSEFRGEEVFKFLKKKMCGDKEYGNSTMQHYVLNRLVAYFYVQKLRGKDVDERELFKVWKKLIELNETLPDKRANLSIRDFRGILNSAIRCGDLEWAKEYLKKFSGKVRKESRSNLLYYGNAIISLHKCEYERSLHYLNCLERETWILTFDTYIMKTQIFYELNYLTTVLSAIDSFRHYLLHRKEFNKDLIRPPLEFIRSVRKLVHLKKKPSEHRRIENLILKLESNPNVSKLNWLKEKAIELRKLRLQ